jgi:hypothetical protein
MIPILTSLIGLGGTWMEGKQEQAKAASAAAIVGIQAQADIEKAKAISATRQAETGQGQDYDLDRIAMEQMAKSWKDEFLLIVFLTPMAMAFVPSLAPYALAGFEIIDKMPKWYQYIIIGMVIVIYGLRGMVKALANKKIGLPK